MEKDKSRKPGLSTKIFLGLLFGAILGIILYQLVPSGYIKDEIIIKTILFIVGQGFIRLMQMLVVPLVFCSLICGSMAMGDSKKLGRVGAKTLGFYLVTTAFAISLALVVGLIFNPGIGLDFSAVVIQEATVTETTSVADTLLNIIPTNPISSLANGTMLQVIFFALIVGVLIAQMGDKAATITGVFTEFNDLMMRMTSMVMKAAPIGVFCLIAKTFAELGFSAFVPMLKYMFCVLFALLIQIGGVYQLMLKIFSGLNPITFMKKFAPVMTFAFSTATSNATIPLSIETLDKKMGISRRISSFTIPLGATINMDGTSIMQGVAVVFVAQAYGIILTPMDYITVILTATLASVGTAGVPGVGLITLSMVFASVGLPIEGIGLIMGIDRILDMSRTATNVTGDAVCTAIVATQEKAIDLDIFNSKNSHSVNTSAGKSA